MAQAVINTKAVEDYQKAAKSAGQLYRAIIPQGASLDKSRGMDGAFRATFRDIPNRIKGQANLVPVDGGAADKLAKASAVNAVMNVASMIVGQYYMTKINDQLGDINAKLDHISDFLKNEYKSKVFALVASVRSISIFQTETMEKKELRERELGHLKDLEHECIELLRHVNLSIQGIAGKKDLNYNSYEKQIGEAEVWFQYQQILLSVLLNISELTYVLNQGSISRDHCMKLYSDYEKQSLGTVEKLKIWHDENVNRLEIDLEEGRRKLGGVFRSMFGWLIGSSGSISSEIVKMIEHQANGSIINPDTNETDMYQEDVQLIVKEGKIYYLSGKEST